MPDSLKDPFPTIGSYGFLSDCHTAALVSYDGAVEWLCLPRFDSPSVFAAMLDRGAGRFLLKPKGVIVPIGRRYEPGTLVIETTWVTETGWVVVHDALTIAEWVTGDGERARPQTAHESDHSLLRTVTCIDGEVEMEMECLPRFGYGLEAAQWTGGELGEALATAEDGTELRLTSDMELTLDGGAARGTLKLREDETGFCAVTWGEGGLGGPRSAPEARERLDSTEEFWRAWLRHGEFPDHPWRIHLQRSALVLKGLTYTPTGAIVAAPTTSLPEAPGGERNWDYRYSWIRDSTFSLWALHTLGFDEEAADFMRFIVGVSRDDPDLQIMYGIGGEKDLTESTLDHLSGYENSKPVRIGNGAYDQRQNDVWGALLDSVYLHEKALRGRGTPADRQLIRYQVEAAIDAFPEPDQGIWESRGEPQHYVSSKLMIWVALDRGVRLARGTGFDEIADEWQAKADEFHAEILERGVRDGIFRQHYDTDALDASCLLIPLLRFLPPDDPRVHATVDAIGQELTEHGLVLRYKVDETDDGLRGREGTFLICSFWMVSALSEIGERKRARELCERLLEAAGWLDLFAEELEAESGRHLGNFPQAFTHLALINAVSHVIADEQREDGGVTAVFSEMGGVRGQS
ncbi:MAG TPA: glycoside hydrolase family 15 protein [Solirubrobacterales bacterium]|jgi:GH15 family glucan-1,4-alpha-glucosidase|nr:glycoside hydrolase family 15 protein [Solirubrobacterales bacterium]